MYSSGTETCCLYHNIKDAGLHLRAVSLGETPIPVPKILLIYERRSKNRYFSTCLYERAADRSRMCDISLHLWALVDEGPCVCAGVCVCVTCRHRYSKRSINSLAGLDSLSRKTSHTTQEGLGAKSAMAPYTIYSALHLARALKAKSIVHYMGI
jgi:hypothetical protein